MISDECVICDSPVWAKLNGIPYCLNHFEQARRVPTDEIIAEVLKNATDNCLKRPNMRALMEEVAEAILADRGKHDDPLRLELVQIAGICINMIRRIDNGEDVSLKS